MTVRTGFRHPAQAIQVMRRRRQLTGKRSNRSKKSPTETVYVTTSLTAIQARPAELADLVRGHWFIEDRLY